MVFQISSNDPAAVSFVQLKAVQGNGKMKILAKALASSWQVFVNGLGKSGFSYFLPSAASSDIGHLPALDRRGTTAGDAQLHIALCGPSSRRLVGDRLADVAIRFGAAGMIRSMTTN